MGPKQPAKRKLDSQATRYPVSRGQRGGNGRDVNASKHSSSHAQPFKRPKMSSSEREQTNSSNSFNANASGLTTAMKVDEPSILPGELEKSYEVKNINIISASQIQKKVTQTLEILSDQPIDPHSKPWVVILQSKAPVASKMITIVEISKREIAKSGGKWFQYNKIAQVTIERKENPKKDGEKTSTENNTDDDKVDDEEERDDFETMKTPFERAIEGKPKVRSMPVMTVFLSRVRIDRLRRAYRYA